MGGNVQQVRREDDVRHLPGLFHAQVHQEFGRFGIVHVFCKFVEALAGVVAKMVGRFEILKVESDVHHILLCSAATVAA
jgi:hypothetical protein